MTACHQACHGAIAVKFLLSLGIGLAALCPSVVRAEDTPPPAARERVELAKRIYRERILSGLERRASSPLSASNPPEDPLLNEAMAEDLHKWSVRWLEAECDAAPTQAGRMTAARAHLDRMIALESGKMVRKELADHPLVKELDEDKSALVDIGVDDLRKVWDQLSASTRRYPDVARYFRLEAEARLAREKAGR
jgi:hypothetical protein